MTEKRFIRIKDEENGISIKDTKTGYERYYAIEVLDDLNNLAEENEQLRIRNELLTDENNQYKALVQKKWGEYLRKREKECE